MKKKLITYRWYIAGFIVMCLVYLVGRLTNLTTLPIFTDEAIYIRWAQIGGRDSEWRFISLVDGKQPMSVWGMMLTTRLFDDPLFAGRLVSVITGFFGMLGTGMLGYELFKNKRIGMLSALLYVASPFTLMYDRLALMDSTVAMFSVWSLYIAILLVRYIRLDLALILGMSLGGAVLTKTSGFLNIYMLPAVLVLFDFKNNNWKIRLVRLVGLLGIAVVLSQVYYSILRLSPLFHMIEQKDGTFVHKFELWREYPHAPYFRRLSLWFWYLSRFFVGNIKALLEWTGIYLTLPITLLILGSILTIRAKLREKILIIVWYSAPIVALSYFGLLLYPRFILFMSVPILVLAAWSIDALLQKTKNQTYKVALVLLFIAYPLYVQAKILFSIVTAPIPFADSNQYINDWSAGWGVREVVDFFEHEAESKQIAVYTDGTFGLMPYALEIYLVDHQNIDIQGIWPAPEIYTDQMKRDIATKPTYYVSNREQELRAKWNGEELSSYKKGTKDIYLRLFRLLPENQTTDE